MSIMRGGSLGMTSRLSQLFVCMSTIAIAIVVVVFVRQDALLSEHASKLAPPKHLRAYLDTFSSTLNNVSSLTSNALDNFLANNFANTANEPIFTNATALPDDKTLNAFVNKFFVHHTPDNLFSPISILYALSYLHLGISSQPQTVKIDDQLLSMESMSQYFAHFSVATNADAHMVQLLCVNHLHPIKAEFQSNYAHFLPILSGNFSHKPSMNENIRRHFMPATQNDVNPIAKGIRPDSTAILYDTFYFRAIWADPFLETQTKYLDFMPSNQKRRNIRALHRVFRKLTYFENDNFQLVEIPFEPRRYVFGIFLPKSTAKFNIKYDMDFETLQTTYLPQLESISNVMVTVPKLRQRQWLRLSTTLKKMSPVYRTSLEKGLTHITSNRESVNEIIHEIPLVLWEAGANIPENTATQVATNDVSHSHGIIEDFQASVTVVANRQFVFYVRDRLTNVFLLVGDFDA